MGENFRFDVFLSHSTQDKAVVREIAERLRKDGVKVWFDEWALKPGDSIPVKIEEGLERSRVLVLCMSANAFGSDWAQLESGTFRFRDPLNQERRFIPLRLDDAPIKGSLAQFLYINWYPADPEEAYGKLLEACRRRTDATGVDVDVRRTGPFQEKVEILAYSFSIDGRLALLGTDDYRVLVRDIKTGQDIHEIKCIPKKTLSRDKHGIWGLGWRPDYASAIFSSSDGSLYTWDLSSGRLREVSAHEQMAVDVVWNSDGNAAISGAYEGDIIQWNITSGECTPLVKKAGIYRSFSWIAAQRLILGGCGDSLRLWDSRTGECIRSFEGHKGTVWWVACSADGKLALSCSFDKTIRLWKVGSGRCLRILEGHTGIVRGVAWGQNSRYAISGSDDSTVRLWDLKTGRCLHVFKGHQTKIRTVAWSADGRFGFSGDSGGEIHVWDLSFVAKARSRKRTVTSKPLAPDQVQYTNAKVLLVGESGAGKTGLSKRLASNDWQPTDSTVGAWATQWKLPVASASAKATADKSGAVVEREIWLWDFGGQADQRLIHQLYMDETALAVLVFDGQKEELFETLGQWDRDLTRASRKEFAKLLVAGRVDAGGLRASRSEVEKFAAERKFHGFLETSAKTNLGCEELKQAILDAIPWEKLPCRTTEMLFKRLKEEIIRLKDAGRVLMRFNELRETLQLRLSGEVARFDDAELRAVLTLLAGPGVVWELAFGSWVLLQPERINAYAQAVIRTLQADEHQRGCLMEERVLKGDLKYESSMERLKNPEEERFVLLAMHQTLVERGLCLRQPTTQGNLLVFPSYYRKERPELVQYPAVQVNYRFTGFLDDIYATLVVRLHHSDAFQQDKLWRYAADFRTNAGKQLGIKLTRRAPGAGELELYFGPAVSVQEKILFSKYVHEHLLQHARDVERLRHYVCPECGTPVGNREVAMQRLNDWLRGRQPEATGSIKHRKKEETPSIICVGCEQRVPLWDEMEQCFASPEIQQRVRDMQEESKIVLDNESKERALVGEVISTVALAAQISREKNVSDHGIDMEIEFKDDANEATGQMLYLQLKSGDSYTYKRRKDGAEIFTLKKQRHAEYWMAQAFPVLLVIRNSEGEIRWMEVRDWLKHASEDGKKPVKQIVFEGERFDVMSVRRWREMALQNKIP